MRSWGVIAAVLIAAYVAGCRGPVRTPWDDLRQTKAKNTDLSLQVQSLEEQNAQLRQQVDTLSGLNQQTRLTELDTLQAIKLHRRTNVYDKDGDGKAEMLVVYLRTFDTEQDQVKTPGRCVIQLWNLAQTANESKLGEWSVTPEELQKLWGGTIFAQYYRIPLPLKTGPPEGQELTVRAVFTDLLSGKVLTDQLAFKPNNGETLPE